MASAEQRALEKLETLDGSRTGNKELAAVRVKDLMPLLQMARLKSLPAAGATPTKAEHDALVADMKMMRARLQEIADAIQKAILP